MRFGQKRREKLEISGMTGAASRYAEAFFALGQEKNTLEAMNRDLGRLRAVLEAEAVLPAHLSRAQVDSVFVALMARLETNAPARDCVRTVIQNGRAALLTEIIRAFERKCADAEGEIQVRLTTARPLTEPERAELASILREKLGAGVRVRETTDPALISGIVVHTGSRICDASLAGQLARLEQVLTTEGGA